MGPCAPSAHHALPPAGVDEVVERDLARAPAHRLVRDRGRAPELWRGVTVTVLAAAAVRCARAVRFTVAGAGREAHLGDARLVEHAHAARGGVLQEELVELRAHDVPRAVLRAERDKVGVCVCVRVVSGRRGVGQGRDGQEGQSVGGTYILHAYAG